MTVSETHDGSGNRARGFRAWAIVAGTTAVAIGAWVMVGWVLGVDGLKRIAPGLATMKFNTAASVALLGAAVASGRATVARVSSWTVGFVAAVTLLQYVTGWNAGIDTALFADTGGGTTHPGRMAVSTAVCLLLGATALWGLRTRRDRLVTGAALTVLVIGWLGGLGYLFGVEALYAVGPFSTMAAHTTVAMVLLGVGLLASVPGGHLAWIVRGDDPGATLLRRIIPLAVVGLPFLGEVRLLGEHAGLYNTEFGLALMVVIAATSVVAVALASARFVNQSYFARVAASEELRVLNATLEAAVVDRTKALAASEEWARTLAASAPVGIFRMTAAGECTYVNPRWSEITGYERSQVSGLGWVDAVHIDDREWAIDGCRRALVTRSTFDADLRFVRPSGRLIWVHVHVSALSASADGFVGTLDDITARREAEASLKQAEELLRTTFESSPVGIALVDDAGRIARANAALGQLVCRPAGELVGTPLVSITDAAGGREDAPIACSDGSLRWTSVRAASIEGRGDQAPLTVVQFVDTTERHELEARLAHQAHRDALTGLLNRRAFEASLQTHAAHCRRYGANGALLMLDLDRFKEINDTHGHDVGDAALVAVANALTERLRETDVVARLGGDEFAVLLTGGDRAGALVAADGVVEAVRRTLVAASGGAVPLGVSVGVVAFDEEPCEPEQMLVRADRAMYDAKRRGRDQWAEFRNEEGVVTATS